MISIESTFSILIINTWQNTKMSGLVVLTRKSKNNKCCKQNLDLSFLLFVESINISCIIFMFKICRARRTSPESLEISKIFIRHKSLYYPLSPPLPPFTAPPTPLIDTVNAVSDVMSGDQRNINDSQKVRHGTLFR